MGKRGGKQKGPVSTSGNQVGDGGITLREGSVGKKQTKGHSGSVKSKLKLQHLQNIALWASGEASIPSLGAFYGHRFAACGEAIGIPPDPSLFPCQRCETLLQPGHNCTVRIEKNKLKAHCRHKHKKPYTTVQNNVVYQCHFCSYRNLKRGTPKGHMKDILPPKPKPSKLEAHNPINHESADLGSCRVNKVRENDLNEVPSPAIAAIAGDSPATPLVTPRTSLLEGKKRKRSKLGAKKGSESESNTTNKDAVKDCGAPSKRKKKSWTSLKEIAESNENSSKQNIMGLTLPFFL